MSLFNRTSALESPSTRERHNRNGKIIIAILIITAIPSAILFGYIGSTYNLPQLYIISAVLIASAIFDFLPLALIRQGRTNRAMTMIVFVFLTNIMGIPFLVQGMGIIVAVSAILVTIAITGLAMSSNYSTFGIVTGIVFGSIALALDTMLGGDRIQIPQLETYSAYIVAAIGLPILIVFASEFNKFSLQVKVTDRKSVV